MRIDIEVESEKAVILDSYFLLGVAITNQAFHDWRCPGNYVGCLNQGLVCTDCKATAVNYFAWEKALFDTITEIAR